MKNTKLIAMSLVVGGVLGSHSALAAIGSEVMVEGKVGDFNDKSVDLTVLGGTKIRVPRDSVRAKEEELRPGNTVAAIAQTRDILVIPRKKAK